ncbi:hypothetical protein ElyMa_000533400 [Elysia marginata]|uniref:BAT2 N-terminal domain-containing protein n=1 Tax=Elysia marginata TaxID=1093978 RepID=A0AAV4G092_9GAST|nr:hypothetical protein ElyMa_000533400 [Elysia marginata]
MRTTNPNALNLNKHLGVCLKPLHVRQEGQVRTSSLRTHLTPPKGFPWANGNVIKSSHPPDLDERPSRKATALANSGGVESCSTRQ